MKNEIKTKELKALLSDYIDSLGLSVFSIGFTLVFDENDFPEVLVGVSTFREVENWVSEFGCDAKYYLWNTAEYGLFEISDFEDFPYFDENLPSRDSYLEDIQRLLRDLNECMLREGKNIYLYAHDVEDDDFFGFLQKSLCKEQLKEIDLCKYI
ncbi:hypothetical protein [Vibrio sp. V15_P4S5T153]|uniref:hypothetical protein n=1 Tax=Vibrio sp. V15_P4S5T153 TaxID=1938669 RepID=UPI000B8EFC48|nr:hypothetical protein [Vibrio sp. V15_P4S5T153]OXX62407.1 hypothetical protein B9J89_10965 [Vibrio sp. V15_P4S5T153]